MKKFLCGLSCGIAIATMVGGAAAGVWDKIDVLRNDITVTVNGKQIAADNFLYNDTTYLPLRAVAEALNIPINYDEGSNTAYIGEMSSVAPTPSPDLSTLPTLKENPNPSPVSTPSPNFSTVNENGEKEWTIDGLRVVFVDNAKYVYDSDITDKLKELGHTGYHFTTDSLFDANTYTTIFEDVPTCPTNSSLVPLEYYYSVILPWKETL